MGFENMLAASGISAAGMAAERLRMEVVANNIANANSTRSPDGGPYRRQEVVFAAILDDRLGHGGSGQPHLGGVQVVGIQPDQSPLPRVYNPGHPDADASGHVLMPNVQLPMEMVNLITATRGYEANLRVMQSHRQMSEQALQIARS